MQCHERIYSYTYECNHHVEVMCMPAAVKIIAEYAVRCSNSLRRVFDNILNYDGWCVLVLSPLIIPRKHQLSWFCHGTPPHTDVLAK
jgi:hypothetical protein